MLKKILIGVAAIIALILVYATTMPESFSVQRSTTIDAPPDVIHAQLIDFHKWTAWSPWEKMDPDMKRTYEGPPSGKGAAYAWEGDGAVGKGRMEITGETPNQVDIRLDFTAPMEASNRVTFSLVPQGNSTTVDWSMKGDNNYLAKLMHVFMDMDSMVGKDFESGLADLKKVAEKAAGERPAEPATSIPTTSP